jgi:hypothetical protein
MRHAEVCEQRRAPDWKSTLAGFRSRCTTPDLVRMCERVGHLVDARASPRAAAAGRAEAFLQRLAGDVRHHVPDERVGGTHPDDRHDVRMLQLHEHGDLALEALECDIARELRGSSLMTTLPRQEGVARQKERLWPPAVSSRSTTYSPPSAALQLARKASDIAWNVRYFFFAAGARGGFLPLDLPAFFTAFAASSQPSWPASPSVDVRAA